MSQSLFKRRFASAGGLAVTGYLDTQLVAPNLFNNDAVVHDIHGSTLKLNDGRVLRTTLMVDATGLETRLTAREEYVY